MPNYIQHAKLGPCETFQANTLGAEQILSK